MLLTSNIKQSWVASPRYAIRFPFFIFLALLLRVLSRQIQVHSKSYDASKDTGI
jgi:hypothetical protein